MDEFYRLIDEIREYQPSFSPKEKMGNNALRRYLDWCKKNLSKKISGDSFLSNQTKIKDHKKEFDDYFDKHKDDNLESFNQDDYTVTDSGNIELKESLLLEITRRQMLDKSKHQSQQSKARFKRRTRYQGNISLRDADFSRFYTDDLIVSTFNVKEYNDTIAFQGILARIREMVERDSRHLLTQKTILSAVSKAVDDSDLLVSCSCPDAQYRFNYFQTKLRI